MLIEDGDAASRTRLLLMEEDEAEDMILTITMILVISISAVASAANLSPQAPTVSRSGQLGFYEAEPLFVSFIKSLVWLWSCSFQKCMAESYCEAEKQGIFYFICTSPVWSYLCPP